MAYIYDPYGELVDKRINELAVSIALDDQDCWNNYPEYRWTLNKLNLCDIQRIKAFPHGFVPNKFPVFSKPVMNMMGLAHGTQVIKERKDYIYKPGHFWMEMLEGTQFSVDAFIEEGELKDLEVVELKEKEFGAPTLWVLIKEAPKETETQIQEFIDRFLGDYTGAFNFELIGNIIIEAVPRPSCQWFDLYGENFIDSLCLLYEKGEWVSIEPNIGWCSRILRVDKSFSERVPSVDLARVDNLYREVSTLYLPWERGKPLNNIPDDPNSFRTAVINGSVEDTEKAGKELSALIKFK